jgi:hypothetical protein
MSGISFVWSVTPMKTRDRSLFAWRKISSSVVTSSNMATLTSRLPFDVIAMGSV